MPGMLGRLTLTVDLDQFTFSGDRSQTRTALNLLDQYGPFILAYLEARMNITDWRASAEADILCHLWSGRIGVLSSSRLVHNISDENAKKLLG